MDMGVPHHGSKVGTGYGHRYPVMGTRNRQEDPGDTDGEVGAGLGDRDTLQCQWQGRCRITRMGVLTVTLQVK